MNLPKYNYDKLMKGGRAAAGATPATSNSGTSTSRPSTPIGSSGSRSSRLSSLSASAAANKNYSSSSAGRLSGGRGSPICNHHHENPLPNYTANPPRPSSRYSCSNRTTLLPVPQISSSLRRDYCNCPSSSSSATSSSSSSLSASLSPLRKTSYSSTQQAHRHSHSYRICSRIENPQSYSRCIAPPGLRSPAAADSNSAIAKITSSDAQMCREPGRNHHENLRCVKNEAAFDGNCKDGCNPSTSYTEHRDHESDGSDEQQRANDSGNGMLESRLHKMCLRSSSSTSKVRARKGSAAGAEDAYDGGGGTMVRRGSSRAEQGEEEDKNCFKTTCTSSNSTKAASSSSTRRSTSAGGASASASTNSRLRASVSASTNSRLKASASASASTNSSASAITTTYNYRDECSYHGGVRGVFLMLRHNLENMINKSMTCLVGLYNYGNTCYLNSCIQCLAHTLPLASTIVCNHHNLNNKLQASISSGRNVHRMRTRSIGLIKAAEKYEPKLDRAHSLALEFQKLICAMWSPSSSVVSASKFLCRLQEWDGQFSGHQQQDAQEAMRAILDSLHESLNEASQPRYVDIYKEYGLSTKDKLAQITWQYHKSLNDSLIQDVFCGQLQSTIQCSVCRRNSHCYDPFLDLSLPLPKGNTCRLSNFKKLQVAIQDCLALFVAPEILNGDDKYNCATCKIPQCSTKKLSIYRAPPILVLHLKRFSGSSSFSFKKDNTPVSYPLKGLDLTEFLEVSHGEHHDQTGVLYDLYAVCHHSGSIGYGHYTAQCKNIDGLWYSFNDSLVTQVDESCVVSPSAYILFYQLRL